MCKVVLPDHLSAQFLTASLIITQTYNYHHLKLELSSLKNLTKVKKSRVKYQKIVKMICSLCRPSLTQIRNTEAIHNMYC